MKRSIISFYELSEKRKIKMLEKYEKSYIRDEIEKLDEWFDCLTKDDNITVHAIESHTVYGTVVFWSDVKGYSYSYKSYCGCGISGCYHSLVGCVSMIFDEKS